MTHVIVHYAEIAVKGKNRPYFEKLLCSNITKKLASSLKGIARESSQLTLLLSDDADKKSVEVILKSIPGIAYFSFAEKSALDNNSLKKAAIDFLKDKEFATFKVNARRHWKENNLSSMELNSMLGDAIIKKYNKKAKMENPDLTLKVEVVKAGAYLSCENINGVGGLPTDQRQKVVCLLSGGFDSPVAAFMLMKRGCEAILVHFQNQSQLASAVEDKIIQLAKQLSKYQLKTQLYIVPFEPIQKQVISGVKAELRMLVYRKIMIRIASAIADRHNAKFLVVGDSLSQVASQTIENLDAVYYGSPKQIFAPLIGMNKEEIISIAKKIGTYDISALPYGDCCSYFVPKHPMLRSSPEMLADIKVDIDSAVGNARRHEF